MALPCGTTGSLTPTFVSARNVSLAVKLPYAFALDGWFPNQPEGTLRASVTFGRRPPQSNYPPDNVLLPVYGTELGDLKKQGWYFSGDSAALAYRLLCLPPILHMQFQIPMSSYSKGAQGLSVFLRERGIFTAISISPSLWPRQCGDRYAIRAGRNLPDKEFRYLRTVIVTAAAYRASIQSFACADFSF